MTDFGGSSPPRRRRRSSFFERQDSLPSVPSDDNSGRCKTETNDAYLKKLEKEYNDWKNLYNERKSKANELKRKVENTESSFTLDEDKLDSLLPSDVIEFLKNKPDIDKVVEDSLKLCDEFNITKGFNDELLKSNDRMIEHVKNSTRDINKYICNENSFNEETFDNLLKCHNTIPFK